jgi:RND superfamily putative drug exporter
MMGSVGKAVAISGVAVAIGLSSLTVFEAAALRSMGIAGVITVVSTLLFGLTVLPALLALLGPRVNRLRLPLPRALRLVEDDTDAADRRQGHGAWSWVASRVMRRPLLIAAPVLAFLLLLGSPILSLELSTGQNLEDLPRTPARTGFEILIDEFPAGETDPITLALTWSGSDLEQGISPDRQEALAGYIDSVEALGHVTEVESVLTPPGGMDPQQWSQLLSLPASQWPEAAQPATQVVAGFVGEDTTRLRVFSDLLPDSDAGRALVGDIREVAAPDGAQVLTAGLPSRSADFMASFTRAVPIAILIVVVVTGGVLFLTFGSVFLPIKAVLMSLVSISASFGALVWIFQQGHFADQLGFEPSGALGAWLPLIMFAILFGLSMDYEVFLLSRIRERYVAHGDNTRAVAEGIGLTGGIITGAALIMVAVFAAFALSSITFIKALGLTMALAVLIDATVVRGILVPAFMRVMGWVNWWAPHWLQRLVARLGLYEGPTDADAVAGASAGVHALPTR